MNIPRIHIHSKKKQVVCRKYLLRTNDNLFYIYRDKFLDKQTFDQVKIESVIPVHLWKVKSI